MDSKQLMQSKMEQRDPADGWYLLFFLSLLLRVQSLSYLMEHKYINTSFEKCFLQSSGLPWIPPKKALSLDLSDLSDTISGAFGVCFLLLLFPFNRKSNFLRGLYEWKAYPFLFHITLNQ